MTARGAHLRERGYPKRAELDQAERPAAGNPVLSVEETAAVLRRDDHVDRHAGEQHGDERYEQHE